MVNGVTMSAIAANNATPRHHQRVGHPDGRKQREYHDRGAIDSVLHIAGPGTVLLRPPANYLGKWSVDTGTNQLGSQGAWEPDLI